ncbi:MAG: type secretion system protein VirB8 [Sphingomonadales bacterium]|jgi:type IV secretion system protein VirB8|nr:type secretion system protein VirB8 [Sphingomonadales bacterium]
MNEQSREALDAYYKEAATWNRDRIEAVRASRRIAWWVAGSATVVAVLLAFTLMLLMPLKTVVPYTLLVDRNTGFVQALKPLDPDKVAPDTALTQSFLVQYVIARESFDIDAADANYRKVALWSAETARSDYLGFMQVSNPASPLVLYPRSTVIETRVKSVSPVGRNAALVRFDTLRRDAGGQLQPPRSWVALVRYRYSGEPMKLEDRFVNPLGFQVLRYRRDPETLAPESVTTSSSTTTTSTSVAVTPPAGVGVTVVTPGPVVNNPSPLMAPVGPSPLAPAARAAAQRAQARRAAEPQL